MEHRDSNAMMEVTATLDIEALNHITVQNIQGNFHVGARTVVFEALDRYSAAVEIDICALSARA
eukprot:2604609-Pleurochrysis_carterae.AAC.1